MLFPISDDNRDVSTTAYVTYTLLALNIAVFIYQMANPEFTYAYSVIPQEITQGVDLIEPVDIEVPGGYSPVSYTHLTLPTIYSV